MGDSPYVTRVSADQATLWHERAPLLRHLDIELTERCNNNCIHCYINLPENDVHALQRESSTVQIKSILTDAASFGALSVRLTGGEPLLRADFAELYLFARRLGLKVLLFTNARLITPELADLFARVPPLAKIEVTVYGMKRESYEAVTRVRGSYVEFRRGVQLLLERNVPFVVKGALLPPNRDEVDAFDSWAATIPGMNKPPGYAMFFDLRGRHDSPVKNRQIESLRLAPETGVAVMGRQRKAYLNEMHAFCSKFMHPSGDRLFTCGAGANLCVDAYGCLQPCLMLRHPDTVYDLKSGSLKDALADFFPRLREKQAGNQEYLSRCARCFLKGLCEQCPAKSWTEHGTLDTPVEYCCGVAHIRAEDLGLLGRDEKGWEVTDWKQRIEGFSGNGEEILG